MNSFIITQAGHDDIQDMELNFHWWRMGNRRRAKKMGYTMLYEKKMAPEIVIEVLDFNFSYEPEIKYYWALSYILSWSMA